MNRLDRSESERGKSAGMELVARGKEDTVLRGIEIIKWLAARHAYITCDDMWARGFEISGDARILGVIFRQAAELGIIRKSRHFVETIQKKSHRAPIQVWRSHAFDAEPFLESKLYSRLVEVREKFDAVQLEKIRTAAAATAPKARPRTPQRLRNQRRQAATRKQRRPAPRRHVRRTPDG